MLVSDGYRAGRNVAECRNDSFDAPAAVGQNPPVSETIQISGKRPFIGLSPGLVGVYLVFSTLIVPAVATYRYTEPRQLPLGYALALVSYVIGLAPSAVFDLPSSPVIVWAMALVGLLVHFGGRQSPQAPIH